MNGNRPAWMVFLLLLATTLVLVAIMIVAGNTLALALRGAPAPLPPLPAGQPDPRWEPPAPLSPPVIHA